MRQSGLVHPGKAIPYSSISLSIERHGVSPASVLPTITSSVEECGRGWWTGSCLVWHWRGAPPCIWVNCDGSSTADSGEIFNWAISSSTLPPRLASPRKRSVAFSRTAMRSAKRGCERLLVFSAPSGASPMGGRSRRDSRGVPGTSRASAIGRRPVSPRCVAGEQGTRESRHDRARVDRRVPPGCLRRNTRHTRRQSANLPPPSDGMGRAIAAPPPLPARRERWVPRAAHRRAPR